MFPGFPFSSKTFPAPFFNRGKTGRLGRTEVSAVNLNTDKQMSGHVVYAELITWACIDLMVAAPLVSLPTACSCELSFWPTQDHFVERMQQHTSLSLLHLLPALFPASS